MPSLIEPRIVYRPLEYPEAEQYALKQQQAHWLHTEVSMASDLQDWHSRLTDAERAVVGNVLKGFTQVETVIGEYWSTYVTRWFPKPEVAIMARAFSNMEGVHTMGYAYLNTSLGLEDFDAFLYEPTARAKIDALMTLDLTKPYDVADVARSLAVFSAFAEGVQLFSSFALLMSFSRRNLLKGVGQIVAWSIRDESMHSEAGCWLFRTLCAETPGLRALVEDDVRSAARTALELEHAFIDMCFGTAGEIDGLTASDLKQLMIHRANTKLIDLGYSRQQWCDLSAVERLAWFDALSGGVEHQDFFALRPTAYSKGTVNWTDAW